MSISQRWIQVRSVSGTDAEKAGGVTDRGEFARVLRAHLRDHPDGPLTQLGGILLGRAMRLALPRYPASGRAVASHGRAKADLRNRRVPHVIPWTKNSRKTRSVDTKWQGVAHKSP